MRLLGQIRIKNLRKIKTNRKNVFLKLYDLEYLCSGQKKQYNYYTFYFIFNCYK